jgi:hypothetical protein
MDYILSLPLDDFNLSKFTPFPGAPICDDIRSHGSFQETWEQMNAANFVFIPDGLTREILEKHHREIYRRHFLKKGTLLNYLTMVWKSPDSWRRFWLDLPSFLKLTRS